jgi:predicted dehydrogenase
MVRFGVVGVRNFAQSHIRSLEKLQKEGIARLGAVLVVDPELNGAAALSLENAGIKVFRDYDSMLAEGREYFDVVSLPVSIHTHAPMAIKGMQAGYDVLVEKPPAPTIQELDRMIAVSKETGRFCAIGFQFIHSVTIRRLKDKIVNGDLGDITDIACKAYWPRLKPYYTRNAWAGKTVWDGHIVLDGPINNALAHYLNNMLFLASPVPDQQAEIDTVQAELYRGHTYIQAEDTSCLRVACKSGATVHFYVTHCSKITFNPYMEITGTRGKAVWRMNENTEITYSDGTRETFNNNGVDPWLEVFRTSARAYTGELEKPYCRADNTRSFVLAINGAYESSRKIHPVPLEFITEGENEAGDFATVIEGIEGIMDEAFSSRKLLSEIGVPWSVKTEPFSMEGYTEFKLPREMDIDSASSVG